MTDRELIEQAIEARKMSYSPYSHYAVGAALLCEDGSVYQGCNIENAAYTPCNCAERTAFFKAVSEGKKRFSKIAVVGGKADASELDHCTPCGVCRQVMMEFVRPSDFQILMAHSMAEYEVCTLEELLPRGFGPANLELFDQ